MDERFTEDIYNDELGVELVAEVSKLLLKRLKLSAI